MGHMTDRNCDRVLDHNGVTEYIMDNKPRGGRLFLSIVITSEGVEAYSTGDDVGTDRAFIVPWEEFDRAQIRLRKDIEGDD